MSVLMKKLVMRMSQNDQNLLGQQKRRPHNRNLRVLEMTTKLNQRSYQEESPLKKKLTQKI